MRVKLYMVDNFFVLILQELCGKNLWPLIFFLIGYYTTLHQHPVKIFKNLVYILHYMYVYE
jgi:hypothetical protein